MTNTQQFEREFDDMRDEIVKDLNNRRMTLGSWMKVKAFFLSHLAQAEKRGAERAVEYLMNKGRRVENPVEGANDEPVDASFYQIYTGDLESAKSLSELS